MVAVTLDGIGRKRGISTSGTFSLSGYINKINYRDLCAKFADWAFFQTISTVFTLYALFADDIRLTATTKNEDVYFDYLTIAAISTFATEIIVSVFGKPGYFASFFFYLDFVATVTLPLDLTNVYSNLFAQNTLDEEANVSGSLRSTSRAGSRAGRVIRLLRLVRLLRIIKLYKLHVEQARKKEMIRLGQLHGSTEDDERDVTRETRVGKKLTEITTRRVILIVLAMLFFAPFWRYDGLLTNADTGESSADIGIDELYGAFYRLNQERHENPEGEEQNYMRDLYERKMLLFMYYHNPFAKYEDIKKYCLGCHSPDSVLNNLFWIGYVNDAPELENMGDNLALKQNAPNHENWNKEFDYPQRYSAGQFSRDVRERIGSTWNHDCYELKLEVRGLSLSETPLCPQELRDQEKQVYVTSKMKRGHYDKVHPYRSMRIILWMDQRESVRTEAAYNTYLTVFVVFVLAVGSFLFSRSASQLVLNPVERMMARMEQIRKNPFEAMKMSEEENQKNLFSSKQVSFWRYLFSTKKKIPGQKMMETDVLEKTIIKLGGLCALGFGEAGSLIIASNMKGGQSAEITAMVPGRRVNAIFGFCDIRNFTDATEILQDAVMLFVNQIAEIMHTLVDEHRGAPNKNIGDAFLIVWRMDEDLSEWQEQRMADLAILCFVRVIAACGRSPVLASQTQLLRKHLPNYNMKIGYGMHLGWAIEGAIGSEFKIDASYLSPNVNVSSKLEGATKTYGVSILMSDALVQSTTENITALCRKIDHVIIPGQWQSFYVWCIDLDADILTAPIIKDITREIEGSKKMVTRCSFTGTRMTRKYKYEKKKERMERKQEYMVPSFQVDKVFAEGDDIVEMRKKFTNPELYNKFAMAFLNYEAGEWPVAKTILEQVNRILSGDGLGGKVGGKKTMKFQSDGSLKKKRIIEHDGPAEALLTFMKESDFVSPENWKGYRELAG